MLYRTCSSCAFLSKCCSSSGSSSRLYVKRSSLALFLRPFTTNLSEETEILCGSKASAWSCMKVDLRLMIAAGAEQGVSPLNPAKSQQLKEIRRAGNSLLIGKTSARKVIVQHQTEPQQHIIISLVSTFSVYSIKLSSSLHLVGGCQKHALRVHWPGKLLMSLYFDSSLILSGRMVTRTSVDSQPQIANILSCRLREELLE